MAKNVRVLGPLQLVDDDLNASDPGGRRQRRLLAALVIHRGNVVSVDSLLDIVFEGQPTESSDRTLQTYVSRLRAALGGRQSVGEPIIERVEPGYVLRLDETHIDAYCGESLLATARAAAAMGDHARAIDAFDEALSLHVGRPYAEFADEHWAIAEAHRLTEQWATAIEDRSESRLALGDHDRVVAELERFSLDEPLRERPRRLLMLALYRSGRQSEALRVYQDYYTLLRDESGLEPSASLREFERELALSSPALDQPLPGAATLRGYQLFEQLGVGAFCVVYRGTQPSVDRDVAVKVIRPELANDPDFVRRFEIEARMVANLEHPHIVPLYDYWRQPDGAFLIMRYLRAGTLRDRLVDGPLDLETTCRLISHIGDALATAHRQGIVHRDIKPANVYCDDDGNFYLGDFGIAAGFGGEVQLRWGTTPPDYAAPEVVEQRPIGPAADIYSLGRIVQTALGPGLPSAVAEVVQTATATAESDRYSSPSELVDALLAAAEASGERPSGRRPSAIGAAQRPRGPNPYKGLRAFGEADAADFFGRAQLQSELLDALAAESPEGRLITLVGPSGSGKSSLVSAGVVPAIRRGALPGSEDWFVATVMPGASPFAELEAALLRIAVNPPACLVDQLTDGPDGVGRAIKRILPDPSSELLLVLDQFEELYTLVADPADRDAFMTGIVTATDDPHSRVRVVITLRADFYDRPLRDPRIADRVKSSTVVVTPMNAEELAEAIAQPAEQAGAAFEDGLVARIAADVGEQPGSLPLLQYTLAELYDRSDGALTHRSYEELGGLTKALAGRAEAIYDGLDAAGKRGARRLFTRLVTLGEGTEDTRRRVLRSEVGADPVVGAALKAYGASRLLAFDRDDDTRAPTIEVSHEALIREWPRFRAWVDEDREGIRVHRHLSATAQAWSALGDDPAELYRGGRLDAALAWLDTGDRELTMLEGRFLAVSRIHRYDEIAVAEQQTRRLRRSLMAVGVVALIAALAGGFALREQLRADDARALAEERLMDAQAFAIRAASSAADDPVVATLLAIEAVQSDPGPASTEALSNALLRTPAGLGTVPDLIADQETWVDVACNAVDRNLTVDEWNDFIPGNRPHEQTCPQHAAGGEPGSSSPTSSSS